MKFRGHTISTRPLPTIRLAASYLSIIMLLVVGFSGVLYETSTNTLNVQILQTNLSPTKPPTGHPQVREGQQRTDTVAGPTDQLASPIKSMTDTASLHSELQKRVAAVRKAIAQRLIVLNVGALFIGCAISYILARRTLRPIEKALDAQSQFASDASHELRTPLTVMQAEMEVALRKKNLTLRRAKSTLTSAKQEVTRMQSLAEGLLRLAQSEQRIARKPVSLDTVIMDASYGLMKAAQAKDIEIVCTPAKVITPGDRQALVQLVSILLENAIRYSPPHSAVTLRCYKRGAQAYVAVTDQGPGIAKADLPHIFKRFYRAKQTGSHAEQEGYGLGLAIAHSIVAQHRGRITTESTVGKGTAFVVQLPLVKTRA